MAAATVSLSSSNQKTAYRLFQKVRRLFNIPNDNPDGLTLVLDSGAFTPANTSTDDIGDRIKVFSFPYGYHYGGMQIVSTADVDTGSGAIVYDVTIYDPSDASDSVLISGCTVGATGTGKDEGDLDTGYRYLDLGGKELHLKITTPANANAGTGSLRVKLHGYQGDLITP